MYFTSFTLIWLKRSFHLWHLPEGYLYKLKTFFTIIKMPPIKSQHRSHIILEWGNVASIFPEKIFSRVSMRSSCLTIHFLRAACEKLLPPPERKISFPSTTIIHDSLKTSLWIDFDRLLNYPQHILTTFSHILCLWTKLFHKEKGLWIKFLKHCTA